MATDTIFTDTEILDDAAFDALVLADIPVSTRFQTAAEWVDHMAAKFAGDEL